MTQKRVVSILFIAYTLFIVWYTIISREPGPSRVELRLFWAYRELFRGDSRGKANVVQNLYNVLFFIPFGMLFPLKKWQFVLLTSFTFSVIIEAIQYIGGFSLCELDDVICNTLGAMVGVWIVLGIQTLVQWKGTK